MTDQTEFTPEIKAEAVRLWKDACLDAYGHEANWRVPTAACSLALCRLLVATGFRPDVDPIEAKAREIVAANREAVGRTDQSKLLRAGDSRTLSTWSLEIILAREGILAGMEMGKP